MEDKEDAAKARAERAFKRQEEGAQAMSDYEVEGLAVRAKTVRLKAQRLDKEAKEKSVADAKKKPASNPSKTEKRRGRPAGRKASARAAEMAGEQLDRLGDRSATHDQRASRKRRLLKGPKEFREMRDDLPKSKK